MATCELMVGCVTAGWLFHWWLAGCASGILWVTATISNVSSSLVSTISCRYHFVTDAIQAVLEHPSDTKIKYEFCGRFMAYALYRGVTIPAKFSTFVYKYLIDPNAKVEYSDYEQVSVATTCELCK